MQPAERNSFLDPLPRRIAVLCAMLIWVGLEIWGGNTGWVAITVLATLYTVWSLFIAYKVPEKAKRE